MNALHYGLTPKMKPIPPRRSALVAVLDPEVLLRDDSAGLPGGAAELRGAPAVGRYALGFSRSAQFVEPALVDGAAGLAIVPQGRIMGALGFTFSGGKITGIDMVSEPGRLVDVTSGPPGVGSDRLRLPERPRGR